MLQGLYQQNKKQEGFTIIEVLIVLAIAGLIMLIVFLAVPALQRNTRNTGRKNDASRIATAVNDFVSNNSGTLPSTVADCQTVMNDAGTLSQYTDYKGANNGCVTSLGTPAANALDIEAVTSSGNAPNPPAVNELILYTSAQCGSSQGAYTLGTPRQAALMYSMESAGGGYQWACLDAQ
jgi:prepilin-type N-terminal cleavage/methylation domain-containing protein